MKRKKWIKASLIISACLFVAWFALGTSATLAWFSDADSVRNEFQIGLLDLDVWYKVDIESEYTQKLQGASKVFNDEALYEPGYTQVVYLKIDNNGDVDFNYKVAVTVVGSQNGTSILGNPIYLPDYLKYGVVFAEDEDTLREMVKDRLQAKDQAPNEWGSLGTWSKMSPFTFEADENSHYAALIIYMPEEVGNVANYKGFYGPKVELGITVFAQQSNAPMSED